MQKQPQLMATNTQGPWAKPRRTRRQEEVEEDINNLIPPTIFSCWETRPSSSGPCSHNSLHRQTLSPCQQFWQIKSSSGSLGPDTGASEEKAGNRMVFEMWFVRARQTPQLIP